ncbi:hypothetical protein [Croceimicrobium hydrocarbonivorans]|uniref:Lipocalin-like domain-containing protein n=1 Tax=Croceimicrobium hydrocarbonivorans TaxID=2761580 RepID=A0A7H0VHD2_9FLAO|nr:hypothetical protein [Croceimicrobium hydrocarbonivorans]QNR25130.1 hypothetical protein H4K34_04640 [Croceimicrobium hydrocarbonivorans]
MLTIARALAAHKMNLWKIISISFFTAAVFSCSENIGKEKVNHTEELKPDSCNQVSKDANLLPVKNKWQLLKINRAWEQAPEVPPQRELWDFSNGDSLIVLADGQTLFKFKTNWKYDYSAFSGDSTWIMTRIKDAHSPRVDFEINLYKDTLELFEQCESFILVKKE